MAYVLGFQEVGATQFTLVGGKASQLAEVSRVDGVRVPGGFCVTTDAFRRFMAQTPSVDEWLSGLSRVSPVDREAIVELSAGVRRTLEAAVVPDDVAAAITRALAPLGEQTAYAVRSSATAEDLPTASFAGQHDSYLGVLGRPAILDHVRRCWASLFTERALAYRMQRGFDPRSVQMAVIVQRMVFPEAAGVLFTADPVTSDRRVVSVEACIGLGDAFVSGQANADVYTVRDGEPIASAPEQQDRPVLTEAQVMELAAIGRRIEAHLGRPQDIEWCLADDGFDVVQSRAITTLFPIPTAGDDDNHVYVSVGHQQMMTDAMTPLGLSVFQLTTPRPMAEAGGRPFVDVSRLLATPTGRAAILDGFGRSDPLTADALQTILDRGDFIRPLPDGGEALPPGLRPAEPLEADPAIVSELIEISRASIQGMTRQIETKSGTAVFDFILEDLEEMKRLFLFDPRSLQVITTAMDAARWLSEKLEEWLGEGDAADTLAQSAPGNVTAEMGLALLDVADAIRRHPEAVAFLRTVKDDDFLDELATLDGGRVARDAISSYLGRYGMRCVGEIDITRPRWSERPSTLVPAIVANIENFEPGAAVRRFEDGRRNASKKEQEILGRLRELADGDSRAGETKRMIDRVRTFAGYREYPKYRLVSRYFVYKQALMREAQELVRAGVLSAPEDIFYLTFQELRDVVRTHRLDEELIRRRRDEHARDQTLTPPRVFTSDGEIITGAYRRDGLPADALVGLPVSAGTVEGRARVILDIAHADLQADDILVTTYTDPSWTPLFPAIRGLVTEVGGLMTHGAVIAREYGLPAIVGVEGATSLIRDRQWIRLHGTEGYIEILSPEPTDGRDG